MKKGSVFGGSLLIAGSCIGVGMLGLPILTGIAGFFPTVLMSFLAFVFMTTTALFLIEVGSWFPQEANLSTQIQKTLGPLWNSFSWMLYLFLFYSLLVAYISLSGIHLSSFFNTFFSFEFPNWMGSFGFVVLFGWIVYLGTKAVDHLNRYLMAGKVMAFAVLMGFGLPYVKTNYLLREDIKYVLFSLPILVISFGFHNMIPALNHYLHGDKKKVKKAIIYGASLTFFIYLLWQVLAIGILPLRGELGILNAFYLGKDAAQAIKEYLDQPIVGIGGQVLALFAILTSFLAQTLSLTHFLADGMKKGKSMKMGTLCLIALLPPLCFAMSYPHIFYQALNFAGGICAVLLFGVIPAMMLYRGKKQEKVLFLKDRLAIYAVLSFSLFILLNQIFDLLGLKIFPHP
ncbi:MAG: amino acid permease [Chlamydiae bacterium]|jgi:tyrosine-specific transport protein|nr:amino acid permease [Chlamydiota bacterium]